MKLYFYWHDREGCAYLSTNPKDPQEAAIVAEFRLVQTFTGTKEYVYAQAKALSEQLQAQWDQAHPLPDDIS